MYDHTQAEIPSGAILKQHSSWTVHSGCQWDSASYSEPSPGPDSQKHIPARRGSSKEAEQCTVGRGGHFQLSAWIRNRESTTKALCYNGACRGSVEGRTPTLTLSSTIPLSRGPALGDGPARHCSLLLCFLVGTTDRATLAGCHASLAA